MRKSPLALLLSLICLISSHNEIQAQGHPPTDSLRQRAAASVGKEKHDLLMRIAMSTNDIADWDATLNDAIDRCDTPAICRSRLNRIQCLFNFYSVDSAIIEARESLPFILNAKQYSFYSPPIILLYPDCSSKDGSTRPVRKPQPCSRRRNRLNNR